MIFLFLFLKRLSNGTTVSHPGSLWFFVLVLQLWSSGQLMKTGAFGDHCRLDLRGCYKLSLCKYWKKDKFRVFYQYFLLYPTVFWLFGRSAVSYGCRVRVGFSRSYKCRWEPLLEAALVGPDGLRPATSSSSFAASWRHSWLERSRS